MAIATHPDFDHHTEFMTFALEFGQDWRGLPLFVAEMMKEWAAEQGLPDEIDVHDEAEELRTLDELGEYLHYIADAAASRAAWIRAGRK